MTCIVFNITHGVIRIKSKVFCSCVKARQPIPLKDQTADFLFTNTSSRFVSLGIFRLRLRLISLDY